MAEISSSRLITILPHVQEHYDLGTDAAGFGYVLEPDTTFVEPGLTVSLEAARPSLVLIEARAAVGKSMLAKYLAWKTNSPLWDLSEIYVGSGTLWGSLAKAFGPSELNSIIGRAVAGEFVLIIDALDEAEMHAGAQAFDAFLGEIRDMYAASRPAPGAVLLGRTETIDYVEMFLGQDLPFSRYHIANFTRAQAYEFIDNRLESGKVAEQLFKAGSHKKRVLVYERARNELFEFLERRLTTDITIDLRTRNQDATRQWTDRVTTFLGYAPVLEAMTEYLAAHVANYPALLKELRSVGT